MALEGGWKVRLLPVLARVLRAPCHSAPGVPYCYPTNPINRNQGGSSRGHGKCPPCGYSGLAHLWSHEYKLLWLPAPYVHKASCPQHRLISFLRVDLLTSSRPGSLSLYFQQVARVGAFWLCPRWGWLCFWTRHSLSCPLLFPDG